MTLNSLVKPGESAIAVTTDGRYLSLSRPTARSGIWKINTNHVIDKVVIYFRDGDINRVFLGEFLDTEPSHEDGRHYLLFWNYSEVVVTEKSWAEFAGPGQFPVRYV
jgi:hypothetical protein